MIKLKSIIQEILYEIFTYPKDARFGLGAIDANGAVKFKEVSRDMFTSYTHGGVGLPTGRFRFRYKGGIVDWTDTPGPEQEETVTNYLEHRGFKVLDHIYIFDDDRDIDDTLEEGYVGRYDIVVGIIFKDGEIKSKKTTYNHTDIAMGGMGKRWRYNPKTKIVYWWFAWTETEKNMVAEHLQHEYGYDVKGNVCLSYIEKYDSANYFRYFNDAHGNIAKV